jgi:hypothetical protein
MGWFGQLAILTRMRASRRASCEGERDTRVSLDAVSGVVTDCERALTGFDLGGGTRKVYLREQFTFPAGGL